MAKAIDVSQWQGNINWASVRNSGVEIAILKMSGGDAGLYYDSKASVNYPSAKAAGVAVGGYHFAGGKDPVNEADFFLRAMSPYEANDVFVLDWEIQHSDPVGWCVAFINRVIAKTGVRPIIYMNTSTENTYDWSRVINLNIGLWVADYRYTPAQNVPIRHWSSYIMHQYTSGGSVSGITGRVDMDEFFGSADQFKKYGYQPSAPAPVPTPTPTPTPTPEPTPTPTPTPEPTPTPVPASHFTDEDRVKLNKIDTEVGEIKALLNRVFK